MNSDSDRLVRPFQGYQDTRMIFYQMKGFAFDRVALEDDDEDDEEAEDQAEDDIREEMDIDNENHDDVPNTVTYITVYKI